MDSNDDLGIDTWNQIGRDIIGEANSDEFGGYGAVSLSKDGKTLAVGAYMNNGNNEDKSGR